MKNISAIALAAALILPISSVAYGVDTTIKAGAKGALVTSQTGVDATATGSVLADANYGTLISTLNSGKASVDLGAISADADITVISGSSLKAQGNTNALDNALEKNADAMTTLHASINGNTALKSKLETQGVAIESIVAVTTAADGKVTVFVDDRV